MTGTIIYAVLIAIGAGMIFMLTMRVLFYDAYKEGDPMAIDALVAGLKRGDKLQAQGRLGWLQQVIDDAMGDLVVLRRSIEEFRRRVERFHPTLVVAANTAMGVGFFGTVASIASMAGGKIELPIIIGVGMQSTMVGLVIAQPGIAYHGLTDSIVMRFLDQIDAVLEALDGRINPPQASAPVPSPANPSNNGAQRNGQKSSGPADHAYSCGGGHDIDAPLRVKLAPPESIVVTKHPDPTASVVSATDIDDIVMEILTNSTSEGTTND